MTLFAGISAVGWMLTPGIGPVAPSVAFHALIAVSAAVVAGVYWRAATPGLVVRDGRIDGTPRRWLARRNASR